MSFNFRKHRLTLIIIGLTIVIGASVAPFMSASCSTRQQSRGDEQALAQLRTMTRNNVLPAENAVASLESQYPNTKAAGLARILRARIKMSANDYAGAAALLDSKVIRERTTIGDYALLLRGGALEKAGRTDEARAVYEQLARDYPSSIRTRDAALRDASLLAQSNQAAAVPAILKDLNAQADASALLISAKAYEQTSDQAHALEAYRRIYFYAPASAESAEAEASIARLNSTLSPASADEAITRANKLADAKRYNDAANAYADAFSRFPATANAQTGLRRGVATLNAKRASEAIPILGSVPPSAGETRAEALYYLVQAYAASRQWDMARTTLEEMRRSFPQSNWTPRAYANVGQMANDAKNTAVAQNFFRAAVNAYPGAAETAGAQFELAWAAHDAKNYNESSRLLTEHLALYADKNTDYRGRAGYWAARDMERAGHLAEARAIYEAMQPRYGANWYGYLSQQRLDTMTRNGGNAPRTNFAPDSIVGRAVANLQTVTVAEETAGPTEDERLAKADQLSNIGLDDYALDELNTASQAQSSSPRINLAKARIYRTRDDNVVALNILKRSYPDYSQMKPEELTREEWDVFYPLNYWNFITDESRAKRLDPFQVAGLIRQESVFNPRAASTAKAYGLMQLLVPTAQTTAKRYGVDDTVTVETLYNPRLNIRLGTAYLRDQLDKFGRIEYVAAAYNAGPGRVVQWRATLPAEMDEWAEAIPFKETRGYVQGVVRNSLQYKRLYDDNGQFRAEVGTRAVHPNNIADNAPAVQTTDSTIQQRRFTGTESGE